MTHWARWCATVLVACFVAAPLCAQGSGGTGDPTAAAPHAVVTNDMLLNAAGSGDWVMYGHNYWNNRYSPLKTINTTNVKSLVPRAVYTHGAERLGSFETTPVVVNGIMYITSPATPNNIVRAFDLRTQKKLWEYEHKNAPVSTACCGPNNRGVAVANGLIFLGTLDGQLVALDQGTGKEKWAVQVGDPAAGYTETMAPLVVGDNVIIGTSGAEYGIRGFVKAYSAASGTPAWTWYTLPDPLHGGWWGKWSRTTGEGEDLHRDIAKEKADSAKYADAWQHGGGSMWMTPAYDDATKTLYVAIGNPSPDLDGGIRPGDNLWTESVVAISATNGEFKWGYQEVPHDVWDLDAVSPPVIATVGGAKAVVEAGKTGWVYVLDAATGVRTGRKVWQVKTEQPMMGGATATAGGLVFTGEGNGWFKAYDAKTGAELWKFNCGAGANAAPSVFSVDGEEFVAVAAGGNFQISYPLGNSVFVFGLPKAGM